MLWDRGEANGYAAHMTDDPLPNTPPHEVMLQVAFSDHQVSNHAAEVEARTIGAPIMTPGLARGPALGDGPVLHRHRRSTRTRDRRSSTGTAGTPRRRTATSPPTDGGDPHGHPRSEPAAGWQEAQFLLTGWMVDVCDKGDYLTDNNPVNNGAVSCHAPMWAPGSRNK